jgi:hypothetical protein
MRGLFRLLLLAVMGVTVMVACSSAPSTSVEDDSKITPGEGLTHDVAVVATTGRPQFLDSYAVW